ncbi:MAG: aminotransferase class V-fold PLP-dependent enzyme [Planctomycetota bacterium]|jgi:selenocysteine lyase/cysteine desulfurase
MTSSTDVEKILGESDGRDRPAFSLGNIRSQVTGVHTRVPLCDGTRVPYVNLDNAATTPAFIPVLGSVRDYQQYYSGVHRGTGFKSLLSTHMYERCRQIIADFIGADLSYHAVLFTQNATHALNKLAKRLCPSPGEAVILSLMEHHSNVLPWRQQDCELAYVQIDPADGSLQLADLEAKLREHDGRVKIVSLTGGSNVTGDLPPYREIARLVHEHGALFAMDATQLVPHRPVSMGARDDPERVDFLAFSGHKMHAPFGAGVLAGPREVFEQGAPDVVGGGTVHAVTMDEVVWHRIPEREEAGTPNVVGAVAMARAAMVLSEIGMENVAAHERELTRYCLRKLLAMDELRLLGRTDPEVKTDRLGIIALDSEKLQHAQLAAVLGYEWGIGVRNGCFCAQPYVRTLLGIPLREMNEIIKKLTSGDHSTVPGLVRVSLGVYNTRDEIDYLAEALAQILKDGPRAKYVLDPDNMDYVPEGHDADYDHYLPF